MIGESIKMSDAIMFWVSRSLADLMVGLGGVAIIAIIGITIYWGSVLSHRLRKLKK